MTGPDESAGGALRQGLGPYKTEAYQVAVQGFQVAVEVGEMGELPEATPKPQPPVEEPEPFESPISMFGTEE